MEIYKAISVLCFCLKVYMKAQDMHFLMHFFSFSAYFYPHIA